MNILMIGDIYGKTGREALKKFLPGLRAKYKPDWIIANGENVTAGNGISLKHAKKIEEAGVDIITTGNHLFARLDWKTLLEKNPSVLRPENLGGPNAPGSGMRVFEKNGTPDLKLVVINIAGRVFMERARCPFETVETLLKKAPSGIPIVVDFHAEATSEKLAMSWFLAGKVAAVVGTHTHVQTSDERILTAGTAVITDLGMTGSRDGILGVDRATIIGRFVKGYSEKFLCGGEPHKIEGVFVKTDGCVASKIERFRIED
ncbi:MAG: TIGR00282 family metallophosphoesterase [Candidatus Rifleibacteriota bacterium]